MSLDGQEPSRERNGLSRRRFLGVAASTAGVVWIDTLSAQAAEKKLRMPPGAARSRVAQVQSDRSVKGSKVNARIVSEMLERVLTDLTSTPTIRDAWRSILKDDDVIGLKFNRSMQHAIGTTSEVARALIASLVNAGWAPDQIICIEAPPKVEAQSGTTRARTGFDEAETDFGSGSDQLASVLRQVTALIDIPYLKAHRIAGMSCALKNLSHGLIKHPARYHDNGCSPYVADLVGLPAIRSKLRLCLVDALRVVYADGPGASATPLTDEGILLASLDPVAIDSAGLSVLNEVRRQQDLDPVARTPEELAYLAAAHERGLGIALWHGIETVRSRI